MKLQIVIHHLPSSRSFFGGKSPDINSDEAEATEATIKDGIKNGFTFLAIETDSNSTIYLNREILNQSVIEINKFEE